MDQERYEVLDVIGSGGMATVWRARDRRLGRLVAIKRPHPAPDGSDAHARFAREARAAATVSHPNLVAVYDSGEDELGPFLVMEYVDGPSLATADVPRDRAAAIGAEVAAGLAALHAVGVVHGDVKPGNILLAGDRARLTDFGVARSLDETAITQAGVAFGTPAYAAPETIRHGERTPAADVYSLAAVVHELATGARWSADPTTTAAMPEGGLAAALAGALQADPAARPTAAELAATLSGHPPPPPIAAMPVPAPVATVPMGHPTTAATTPANAVWAPVGPRAHRRSAFPLVALTLVVLALALGAAALLARRDDGATIASSPATTAVASTVATSPDGATTVPQTTTPPTPPPTTTPATTTPPTTAPPTTEPAPTAIGALRSLVDDELKRKDARDVLERLDRAEQAAAEGRTDDVEDELREAAERIVRSVDDGETRDLMEDLLADAAGQLGADPDEVTEPFEDDREDDD